MEENRLYILNSTSYLLFPHLPISLGKQIADMTTTAREPSRTSRLDFIMNEVSGKAHSLLRQRDNSRTAILSARPSPFVYHKYAENQATINPYVGRQQS